MSSSHTSSIPASKADPLSLAFERAKRSRAFDDEGSSGSEHKFLTGPAPGGSGHMLEGVPPGFPPALSLNEFIGWEHALKKQHTLSPCSEEDFDLFINVNSQPDHMLCVMLGMLECHDLLHAAASSKAYTIPEDVKESLIIYSQVFVLSPAALFYKRKSCPTTVLAVMRSLNVSGIPGEHDVGRVEVILKAITKALTDACHHVKNQIQQSLNRLNQGTTKVKATLGLFMRIAFLRWVMRSYPVKPDKFWDQVDVQLDKVRKTHPGTLKLLYDEDIAKYGSLNPDCPSFPLEQVDEWIKTMHRFASASATTPITPPL
ncbi:hypothetical protein FA13DRAFT_1795756 [Coprinellus micaceus]|uniref:Uncharacterized protein n=1 Tax=Coprinellus micaceus TaxID=71717 RepID=A0A4Y7SXG9_COPMI|nr:hypothetical protein FA13DRAFT_1795756 [Coprinellus micaceus]